MTTAGFAPHPDSRQAGTLAVLRHPLYLQLLVANFVTSMGVWLYIAVAAWVMFSLTRSPLMVGLVTAATFLPRLVFAIPAGALIDVFDRRKMVVLGNVAQAVVSIAAGVLYSRGQLGPWALIAMTVLLGTGQALSMPAYQSVIQDVIPRDLVAAAVSLHSGSVNVARAVGPAIGGVFLATGRTELAFLLNGLSYFAICAVAVRIPRSPDLGPPELMSQAMRTGVRFVRHSPLLLRIVLVSAMFALTSSNLQALLAPAAVHRHLGPQGYGLLFSCFGLGALIGALTTRWLTRLARGRGLQTWSIAVFGLAGLGFALVPGAILAALTLALAGAAWVITYATLNTTVQLTVPGWVRGRVLSIYMMAITGALPAGAVIAGALAGAVGTPLAIALMSSSLFGVALITHRLRLPAFDDMDMALAPDDWPVVEHAPIVSGGPVLVLLTWTVPAPRLDGFLTAMGPLRKCRLRSGAVRWGLFRDPDQPDQLTELFEVPNWEEHLRQIGRLDRASAAAIRRAREFDINGMPTVRHLVGLGLDAIPIAQLIGAAR